MQPASVKPKASASVVLRKVITSSCSVFVREIDRCCPARVEIEPQGDEIDCDTEIPLLEVMGPAPEFYTIKRASASRMRVNEREIASMPCSRACVPPSL
jgi:hypothetical protein